MRDRKVSHTTALNSNELGGGRRRERSEAKRNERFVEQRRLSIFWAELSSGTKTP